MRTSEESVSGHCRAVAKWVRSRWSVTATMPSAPTQSCCARDVADIEARARKLVSGVTGLVADRIGVEVQVRLRGRRQLTITNADHGLDRHPTAGGIEWADHGFALTRLCRRHVHAPRCTYGDLDPEGPIAVVYDDQIFGCDGCNEGDDQ